MIKLLAKIVLVCLVQQGFGKSPTSFNLDNNGKTIAIVDLNANGELQSCHVIIGVLLIFSVEEENAIHCYLLDEAKAKLHETAFSRFLTLDKKKLNIVSQSKIDFFEKLAKESIVKFWKLQKNDDQIKLTEPLNFSAINLDFKLRDILIRKNKLQIDNIELKDADEKDRLDREFAEGLFKDAPNK